LKDPV